MKTSDKNQGDKEQVPSFRIHRADGAFIDTLTNAFVFKRDVTIAELRAGKIVFDDGSEWTLVLEGNVLEAIEAAGRIRCIVSFQVHTYGTFAVARKHQTNPPKQPSVLRAKTLKGK